jgi:hypothetical protein
VSDETWRIVIVGTGEEKPNLDALLAELKAAGHEVGEVRTGPKALTTEEKFDSKVDFNGPQFNGTPCWLWVGAVNRGGYGNFRAAAGASGSKAPIGTNGYVPDQVLHRARLHRPVQESMSF